jgi:hypothetical protein
MTDDHGPYKITTLAKRLDPFIRRKVGEGIEDHSGEHTWGRIVLIYPDATPAKTYEKSAANLVLATETDATSGSMVWVPPATYTTDLDIPTGVGVASMGNKAIIAGKVSLGGEGSQIKGILALNQASSAGTVVAIEGPATGQAIMNDSWGIALNEGSGNAVGLLIGEGQVRTWGAIAQGYALEGDGFGVNYKGTTTFIEGTAWPDFSEPGNWETSWQQKTGSGGGSFVDFCGYSNGGWVELKWDFYTPSLKAVSGTQFSASVSYNSGIRTWENFAYLDIFFTDGTDQSQSMSASGGSATLTVSSEHYGKCIQRIRLRTEVYGGPTPYDNSPTCFTNPVLSGYDTDAACGTAPAPGGEYITVYNGIWNGNWTKIFGSTTDINVPTGAEANLYACDYDFDKVVGFINHLRGDRLSRGENEFNSFSEKVTPVTGDWLLLEDSVDGFAKKKVNVDSVGGGVDSHNIISDEHPDTNTLIAPAEGDLLVRRTDLWEAEAGVDIGSDAADIDKVNFTEQVSDPTAPGAGHRIVYAKNDGFYERDSAGVVSAIGAGDVASDVIWDAKGDLAVGTGADTALRLAVGSNTQMIIADSSLTRGLRYRNTPSSEALMTGSGASLEPLTNEEEDDWLYGDY